MKNIKQSTRKYALLAAVATFTLLTILGLGTAQRRESMQRDKEFVPSLSKEVLEAKIKGDYVSTLPGYDATAHWLGGSEYEDFMIAYTDSVSHHK